MLQVLQFCSCRWCQLKQLTHSLVSSPNLCRHHLSSVHPYRVGVQSEPGCSSPYYLPTYVVYFGVLTSSKQEFTSRLRLDLDTYICKNNTGQNTCGRKTFLVYSTRLVLTVPTPTLDLALGQQLVPLIAVAQIRPKGPRAGAPQALTRLAAEASNRNCETAMTRPCSSHACSVLPSSSL